MSTGAIRLEQRTIQAGRKQAEERMRVWNFYRSVDKDKTRDDTRSALERVVESSGKIYGTYMAVMQTLLPSNPLGTVESVPEKKVLNLFSLYVGCQEALHELGIEEEANDPSTVPLHQFSLGMGKASDYHYPLDNVIKYHAALMRKEDIPEQVPKQQIQEDFLLALKRSIEQEVRKPAYAALAAKMKKLPLGINGRMYNGFSSQEVSTIETTSQPKIILPEDPDKIVIVGNEDAQQELDSLARIIPLYDVESKTNAELAGQKPISILLYGPPGTGKTLMIKKFLAQVNRYASLKGTPFHHQEFGNKHKSKWHGDDNKNLSGQFGRVQNPKGIAVGTAEDVDGSVDSRSNPNSSFLENQTLHEYLNQLDGLQTSYCGNYVMIFTTNHVENVDSALFKRMTNIIEVKGPTQPSHYSRIFMIEMGDRLPYVQMDKEEVLAFGKQCHEYGFTGRDINKIAEVVRKYVTNAEGITPTMHLLSPTEQQSALHKMRRRVGYDFVKETAQNRYRANVTASNNEKDAMIQRELLRIEARHEAGMRFISKQLGNGSANPTEVKRMQDAYREQFIEQLGGMHG